MTRAQYVQLRANMNLIATLVREMPLADFLATNAQALQQGPAQQPKMWADGQPQLEKDQSLAAALVALQRAVTP